MNDADYQKLTERCASIIRAAASGTGRDAAGLAESPVRFLSRLPEEERIYLLAFLEAYIAAETENAESFQQDLIMAVNEFLMERSSLSVRMLNLWVKEPVFDSLRDTGTWIGRRYSTAVRDLRENMQFDGDNTAAGIIQIRNWCTSVCRDLIEERSGLPPKLERHAAVFRNLSFREDPLLYLQSIREEERRRTLLIPAAILLQSKGRDIPALFSGGRRELIETTLLMNRYCKYPEDTELQTRLLLSFFRMDAADFTSERTRHFFFNERIRYAAYAWNTGLSGCRRQILQLFDKIRDLFEVFPEDLDEPSPALLQQDEAILNIPAFGQDPVAFLRTSMKVPQTVHLLLMLSASQYGPREAMLRAAILGDAVSASDSEALERASALTGIPAEDEASFARTLGSHILQTASLWKWNKQDCRKKTKKNWAAYEEAFERTFHRTPVPARFAEADALMRSQEFAEDPVFAVRLLREETLSDCLGLCGLVRGLTPEEAAANADAAATWLRDPRNEEAAGILGRINRLDVQADAGGRQLGRKILAEPSLLWCYNICGAADMAMERFEEFRAALEERRRAEGKEFEQEPEDLERFYNDTDFQQDPCGYLCDMTELNSRRLLLYAGRAKGLSPKAAIGVSTLFSEMLRCPNDGIRHRLDVLFSTECLDDEERCELISVYLQQEDAPETGGKRPGWTAYRNMFDRQLLWEQKNHWELNTVNVNKLYAYCVHAETGDAAEAPEVSAAGPEEFDLQRLYGDRVVTILRCMAGQLEVVHAACRGEEEVRFAMSELRYAASAEGEPRPWTQDDRDVRTLWRMAMQAEILPPTGRERPDDPDTEYLDLQPGVTLHAIPVLYNAG